MNNKKELKSYLPHIYEDVYEMNSIIEVEGSQFDKIDKEIGRVLEQFFVDKTTYEIEHWENIYGLTPDLSKTIEQRRSAIKSRIRGRGKLNKQLIKNVVDAYTDGQVDVLLRRDLLIIRFNSIYGIPETLDIVKRELDNIKPAHLGIEYRFAYLLIKDVHKKMTLEEIENVTLDKFAGKSGINSQLDYLTIGAIHNVMTLEQIEKLTLYEITGGEIYGK